MKILRVFTKYNNYTPCDELVAIGSPGLFRPEVDEVHISCVFSWDVEKCLNLQKDYKQYHSVVKLGGPGLLSFEQYSDYFVPGRYVKKGITFTTRGCDFKCKHCLVDKIEGNFRELKDIQSGNIVQDNNILLSSKKHLNKVFLMLKKQKGICFKGGIDCRLLKGWHIEQLKSLRIKEIWLALDSDDNIKYFKRACGMLSKAGFSREKIRCYVLAGFGEPIRDSENRLRIAYEYGSLPYVQLYQDYNRVKRMAGELDRQDNLYIRDWSRPAIYKNFFK